MRLRSALVSFLVAALALVAACTPEASRSPSTTTAGSTTADPAPTMSPAAASGSPPAPSSTSTTDFTQRSLHDACLDRARFGDPAESPYLLPFPPGSGYSVLQSYCTEDSSHENQLAYDFLMPIGSSVTAARAGTVVDLREDVEEGSHGSALNYLVIRHSDGSLAFYAHLTYHGVLVELWDTVEAGQPIALSGATGRTYEGGLLHFGVYAGEPVREGWDLAVNFGNAEGPLDARGGLRAGSFYRALEPAG